MIKNASKIGFTASSIFPFLDTQDNLKGATKTEQETIRSADQNETGVDRVKRMFEVDEFGNLSKELVTIMHASAMSAFVGAIYGGVIFSRVAYVDFIKNNQATAFKDHLDAKKKLQDKVTLSFARGAWKWGWRLSLFTTSFMGVSTVASVYRGESGILEYVAAGMISGSLYKFNMGPRGWLVGGGLGGTLGLMAGVTTWGLLKLFGMSMDDVRYWQYKWKQDRARHIQMNISEHLSKEEDELTKMYNLKVGEAGKSLDHINKT